MVKGKTREPMGGRLVVLGPRPFEYNTEPCPVCYAVAGYPCARLDFDRGRGGSKQESHRTDAARLNFVPCRVAKL